MEKYMNLKSKLFLYVCSFIFWSCDPIIYEIKPHYSSYFPVHENDSSEFRVLEIQHTSLGSDTLQYFLKEVIRNPYIDGQGDIAFQMHRYWKQDSTEQYQIKDVWSIKKTVSSVEQVEENIRFVKMIFPLDELSYWDGNVFNHLGEQEYAVSQIHTPYNMFGLSLDSVVEITHEFNTNLLEYDNAIEIYALHKGLIYKEEINLSINNGDISDINYGTEYTQTRIE